MIFAKNLIVILISFSSGMVISGGVFAFIAMIGIIPRLAQKTKTEKNIPVYENAIVLGGLWGTTTFFIDYSIPAGAVAAVIVSCFIGMFVGGLAVSLAEILNIIPITVKRFRIFGATQLIVTSLAFGKLAGSLLYYIVPGFYTEI
ncbi:MAG: stage V sporulation protein AB [Firmicutes bacterium]|nr:stage V sporulation protein AB [Bacillota bacterium]